MKKKYADNSDEENEFDVDEPEEIQNNASDDDWTPDKDTSGGRRQSSRLRNIPISRAPIIDASSTDEENSDDSESSKRKSKGRGRGRPFLKKQKVSSSTTSTPVKVQSENGGKSANSDSEPSSTTTTNTTPVLNTSINASPTVLKVNKDFTSGAFVVLKTDAANMEQDPPLWKIDGKALLQKYIPFEQEGKTFYKNTSVYSGWTLNNKDNYYPVTVIFKQQTRKEHIVEFRREQIKFGDGSEISSSTTPECNEKRSDPITSNENSCEPIEKPVIKVKSFAIVPEEETKTPAKPIDVDKPVVTPDVSKPSKINVDYASGSFLVLRSDAANVDPPIWKIDGKALLQKYTAFTQNEKTLYKNTAEYSGWSLNNKNNYFPVTVTFKQQIKKDHIVELNRIRWDEPNDSGKED